MWKRIESRTTKKGKREEPVCKMHAAVVRQSKPPFSRLDGKRKMCKEVERLQGCGVVVGKVGATEAASTQIKEANIGSLHGTENMCV